MIPFPAPSDELVSIQNSPTPYSPSFTPGVDVDKVVLRTYCNGVIAVAILSHF